MNVEKLAADIKAALKSERSSLATESLALGWSKNRLGQILKQDKIELNTYASICEHFDLDFFSYTEGEAFPYFWRVKHLVSDCSVPYNKTLKVEAGQVVEIYGDTPIKFKAWGRDYEFPEGCSYIVSATEGIITYGEYYVVAEENKAFTVKLGEDIKKKPKYLYKLISVAVRGARPKKE
ncbi:MAG: hypothetical protein CMB24_07185 [Euryarchaeota archaeon]|nr:hypothetical protein [Euryarchaeota archaeon]|tara:strand:+ start:5588 stop:6124 length:537 start_codon:yes stop_codon:yes gene_type:complete